MKIVGICKKEYEGHAYYTLCLNNSSYVLKDAITYSGAFASNFSVKANAVHRVLKDYNIDLNALIGRECCDVIKNDKKQIIYFNIK